MEVYEGRLDVKNDILAHYGTKRHSGRYPWGSGENPYQHSGDFLSRVYQMKKEGLSEKDIAESFDLSVRELRAFKSIATSERRADLVATAKSLKADGLNNSEIGRKMGISESSVRALFDEESEARMKETKATADFLRNKIDNKGIIDIGKGVEKELNISRDKLEQAVIILEAEGYTRYGLGVPQVTNPGQQTNFQLLCPPGTSLPDAYNAAETNNIHYITDYYSQDGGTTFRTLKRPESLSSDRIQIRYGNEGGTEKDGVIELRRNVDDISLGESSYAQVRILVDGTHYLKGMAVYSDDMPDGVDVIFNTNKESETPKEKVFKEITNNPDNPFGAYIKPSGQRTYIDKDGNEKLSVINKVREEGDWEEYSKKLPSQFLSKQPQDLVKKQLNLTYADKVAEFDDICKLTNPTLKKKMLNDFADDCDGAAIHLKAAALPRQSTKVILPVSELNDNEIYAPTYSNGEKVALIRYPHGGTFEIPILTVNNKQKNARDILGNSIDAVGINSKVASQLSGADFDGDTVTVIPVNNKVKITAKSPLKALEGFDPKLDYPGTETSKRMKDTQIEMGKISNLITDMTLIGANEQELARAVKHSMVVIDAKKHGLDYKRSYNENGIAELKEKYQGRIENGKYTESASTIISRAKGETSVLKRKGSPNIDPRTGEKTYKEVKYKDSNGNIIFKPSKEVKELNYKGQLKLQKSTQMAETKDAYTLVSEYKNPKEMIYADYANKMKSLANLSRKEALNTGNIKYDKNASDIYKKEVDSLNAKLNRAQKTAPKERKAQIIANGYINALKKDNPELTDKSSDSKKQLKKLKQQAIEAARIKVGSKKEDRIIFLTDREWEAIQSGAISASKSSDIFKYVDSKELRQRAMPKESTGLSSAQIAKIQAMKLSGYTISEIADSIGRSSSTVSKYIKG